MTDKVIEIQNLSKKYLIEGNRRIGSGIKRSSIVEKFGELPFFNQPNRPDHWKKQASASVWALRDVSFDVRIGDSIGVIGNNGAGKSTLLKIISRITAPTSGKIRLTGRVGSLLEVGTGFHNELTGRENIYLNGSVLGMTRAEINRKFDEIVSFSEIDTYLDTPVKYYSSGMRMRLAFSVAAHLEPEILLIDEVLSVGDIAFQKKSVNKMNHVVSEGRTVLFVSHNLAAVRSLCSQAVHIEHGKVKNLGLVEDVLKAYISESQDRVRQSRQEMEDTKASGVFDLMVLDDQGQESAYLANDKPFKLRFSVKNQTKLTNSYLSLKIFNDELDLVIDSFDMELNSSAFTDPRQPGYTTYQIRLPGKLFTAGHYSFGIDLNTLFTTKSSQKINNKVFSLDHIAPVEIYDNGSGISAFGINPSGIVHIPLEWEILSRSLLEEDD